MKTNLIFFIIIAGVLWSCKSDIKDSEENNTVVTDTIPVQTTPEFVYVTAVSGLTLRAQPNLQSEKLEVMPLGTKIKLIAHDEKTTMNVGGIDGAMDEVEFENKKGFVFNGFISKFPPAAAHAEPSAYFEDLKKAFPQLEYSETTGGTASNPSKQQIIKLPTDQWHQGFFMAQQLYGIPNQFAFPNPKGSNNETQWANNNKKSGSGELHILRSNNELKKIEYVYKKDKLSHNITITKDNGSIKIEKSEKFE